MLLLQFLRREQRVIRCAKLQEVRGNIRRCTYMHCDGKWFGYFICLCLSSQESLDTYQRRFTDLREAPHCFIHPQVCRMIYKRHCIDWLTQDWLLLWDPTTVLYLSPHQTQCLLSFNTVPFLFKLLLSAEKPSKWLVNTCMEEYFQLRMRIHNILIIIMH